MERSSDEPERCLLAQALLWVSRKLPPIAIEEFIAAPDEVTNEDTANSKELIRHLRAGRLEAQGNLILTQRDYEDTRQVFIRHDVVPSYAIRLTGISFDKNSVDVSRFVEFTHDGDVVLKEDASGLNPEIDTWYDFFDVTVPKAKLLHLFPPTGHHKKTTAAARNQCYRWLVKLMRDGDPDGTKSDYFELAEKKFNVSRTGFNGAWREAFSEVGNKAWTRPGRRPRKS